MAEKSVCKVDGCDKVLTGRGEGHGMCSKHYQRWKRHGNTEKVKRKASWKGISCKIQGCTEPAYSNGLCRLHYRRQRKGLPLDLAAKGKKQRWILKHADHAGEDCLIWPFEVSDHGRGQVNLDGRVMSAPRVMCIAAHGGPPSPNYHAAHSCGKGHLGCMNPKHLSWKTPLENENDKRLHGTLRKGRDINTNKLTEQDVVKIRSDNWQTSGVDLAKRYGVTPSTISDIRRRKSWAWL